jgi:uncharacterized membrane protein
MLPKKEKIAIELVGCHRKPERSFFWKGKQFPVCARCTGIHVGYLTLPFFLLNVLYINMLWTILLVLPTVIDGWMQAKYDIESNNMRRFITGILNGIGSMSLINIVGNAIGMVIYHWIH